MPENVEHRPLFWDRILRFSIYFTVLGVGLGFILGQLVTKAVNEANLQQLKQVQPGVTIEQVDENGVILQQKKDINLTDFGIEVNGSTTSSQTETTELPAIIFVIPFLLIGGSSILMSFIMRKRERKT